MYGSTNKNHCLYFLFYNKNIHIGNYSSTEKAVKLYSYRSFHASPGIHKLI